MEIRKKRQKKPSQRNLRPIYLMGGALGVVLLVAAAFLGPDVVFAMQDDMRCGAVVAVSPEELDVTSFNTGYETDLYKRLTRFAEGLEAGEQYYVTVQDMEITQELTDWLVDRRYWEDIWELGWELKVLPEDLGSYQINKWQRCVIYGDDFAGGVNFILWYLELGLDEKTSVKLLFDGETGAVYGVRTDFESYEHISSSSGLAVVEVYPADEYLMMKSESLWELCLSLAEQYGGIDLGLLIKWAQITDIGEYIRVQRNADTLVGYWEWEKAMEEYREEAGEENQEKAPDEDSDENPDLQADVAGHAAEVARLLRGLSWEAVTSRSEEEIHWDFYFPCGESILTLRIYSDGVIYADSKPGIYAWYSGMTFGFPEIYERIPAFMEEWQ